jgi:hypothetical protein
VPELFTDTCEYVAPNGTVTIKEVVLALVTVAFVAPKCTMLFAAVLLNPEPEIVTDEPGIAAATLRPETTGGAV